MPLINTLFQMVHTIFPARIARAHCDIPCGIYDPITAKIAAQTVLKMVLRMEAVDFSGGITNASQPNTMMRYIRVKDEHAHKVKEELNILWSDYFKPEHVEKYPNLHELFWNANKLAGSNKQGVSSDSAKKLVAVVDEISTIFWATKGIEYADTVASVRFGS